MSELIASGGGREVEKERGQGSLGGSAVVTEAIIGVCIESAINSCSGTASPVVASRLNTGAGPIVGQINMSSATSDANANVNDRRSGQSESKTADSVRLYEGYPSLSAYRETFLLNHACFHDPIMAGKIMENPVMIQGDKYSYDRESLDSWEKQCKKNGHFKVVSGTQLIMNPLNFQSYYNPLTDITENSNLKQALLETSAAIRDHYKRMFPDSIGDKGISEIFDTVMTGLPSRGINSEIFAELDRIRKLDIFRTLNLKPPQIIALGGENNGKSTLLERLIGLAIFPNREKSKRAGGACTICPIRVHLRRSSSDSIATIKIRHRGTKVERDQQAVPIMLVTSVLRRVMEDMRLKASHANPILVHRPSLITEEEIVVEIYSPTCPNLDILDLPGLCSAEEGALKLADEILEQEKDHSLILMVVKNTLTKDSLAPPLILKHELCDKTIGVYTFIDEFKDDETEDDFAEDMLMDLFRPPPDRSDNYFNKVSVWMGVSNVKPTGFGTMSDAVRLYKTAESEEALLKARFPKFLNEDILGTLGKDLLGAPAVTARTEAAYEKYICTNWARAMYKLLIQHFYTLSDKNLRLGFPMPKIGKLRSIVYELKAVCQGNKLFPDYDFDSMLQLNDEEAITKVVTDRARLVCNNLEDWLQLHDGNFYSTLQALESTVISSQDIDIDKSFDETDKIEAIVFRLLRKMQEEILAFGDTAREKFLDAALGNKKVRVDLESGWSLPEMQILLTHVKTFSMSTYPSDFHTSILQFDLIPGLMESYCKFIDHYIQEINDEFRIYFEMTLARLKGNIIMTQNSLSVDSPDGSMRPKVLLRFVNQGGPRAIGDELLSHWLRSFKTKLPSFTMGWNVPSSCLEQFNCLERVDLLAEMLDVAEAIKSIKRLQKKYSDVDDYTELYHDHAEVEDGKKKLAVSDIEKGRKVALDVERKREEARTEANVKRLAEIEAEKNRQLIAKWKPDLEACLEIDARIQIAVNEAIQAERTRADAEIDVRIQKAVNEGIVAERTRADAEINTRIERAINAAIQAERIRNPVPHPSLQCCICNQPVSIFYKNLNWTPTRNDAYGKNGIMGVCGAHVSNGDSYVASGLLGARL